MGERREGEDGDRPVEGGRVKGERWCAEDEGLEATGSGIGVQLLSTTNREVNSESQTHSDCITVSSQTPDKLAAVTRDVPAADDPVPAGRGKPLAVLTNGEVENLVRVTLELAALGIVVPGLLFSLALAGTREMREEGARLDVVFGDSSRLG